MEEIQCACCRKMAENGIHSSDGEWFCDDCCDRMATEAEIESD